MYRPVVRATFLPHFIFGSVSTSFRIVEKFEVVKFLFISN